MYEKPAKVFCVLYRTEDDFEDAWMVSHIVDGPYYQPPDKVDEFDAEIWAAQIMEQEFSNWDYPGMKHLYIKLEGQVDKKAILVRVTSEPSVDFYGQAISKDHQIKTLETTPPTPAPATKSD